jgi:hypothetical protein
MYAVTTGVTHLTYTTGDDGYYVNNFNSSAPSVDGAIMYNDPDYVVGIGSIMLTSLEDRVSIFYSPIGTDPDTKVALQLSRKPSDLTADYLTDPYWVKVSPSNRYAMFDAEVNTSTTALGEIAVEVHPSETATGISFFNLVGNNLNITVTDSTDTEVYNVDVSLDGTIIATPWDWWFRTFRQKQTYVNSEFPPFYNSTIKATLTGTGEVAIGAMQVGKSEYIGMALHGTGFGCDSYSIVEREFNTTKFTRKGNAQLTNVELFVEGWRMPSVAQTLRSLIDTPATFVPTNDDRYSFMSTLGYYQTYNATIEIDGTITMEIRELS